MSIVTVLMKKLFGLIHSLVVCFKRVLCFLKPRRRSDDSLPFTVSSQDPVYSLDGLATDLPSSQTWDAWSDKPFSNPVEDKINEYRKKVALEREQMARRLTQPDEEEQEPDYFNEMKPEVKRAKKILLKPKQQTSRRDLFAVSDEPDIPAGGVSQHKRDQWDVIALVGEKQETDCTRVVRMETVKNRALLNKYYFSAQYYFLMDIRHKMYPLKTSAVDELGLIEDVGASSTGDDAWGDVDADLDVDSVLKEQRHRDRLERQQRRKAEHETRQHHTAQPKRLEAVRISFDS